jgi:hypothetical protein
VSSKTPGPEVGSLQRGSLRAESCFRAFGTAAS